MMCRCSINGWLFLCIWITISCTSIWTQTSSPFYLITAENHSCFGCLAVDAAVVKMEEFPFQVFSKRPIKESLAMLGRFKQEADQYFFVPRFPFRQGKTYWIRWRDQSSNEQLSTIEVPFRQVFKEPSLVAIYPSADSWPANQLKIYLQFDQPMREGVALQYIQLLDIEGREVENPFLEMGQELWDREHKQLTVWFDPGRIKTGLIPNQKYGPPLQEDRVYQLKVQKGFPAKNGQALGGDQIKRFYTSNKDQTRPDPRQWQLTLPPPGTHQPLIVAFPKPLDYGLLKSAIWVEDASGHTIPGRAEIGPFEKSWQWIPATPWSNGGYQLRIDQDIEDLAGNNLQRLFDTFILNTETEEEKPVTYLKFHLEAKE